MPGFKAAQKPADIESLTVRSQENRVLMMSILERLVLDCGALFERDDDDNGAQLTIQAPGGLGCAFGCTRTPGSWMHTLSSGRFRPGTPPA